MQLTINGDSRRLEGAQALAKVLEELGIDTGGGMAVALNDRVVPRAQWDSTPVADGDRIEIIHAVQGG